MIGVGHGKESYFFGDMGSILLVNGLGLYTYRVRVYKRWGRIFGLNFCRGTPYQRFISWGVVN